MRVPSSWASTFSMTSVSVAVRMSVGGAWCQVIQRGVLGPPVSRAELELVGALTVLLGVFLHGLTAQPLVGRYAASHACGSAPPPHAADPDRQSSARQRRRRCSHLRRPFPGRSGHRGRLEHHPHRP